MGALSYLCDLLGPFTRFAGRSLASSPAAMAVHALEHGLALTRGNRLPANPTLCAHRLAPLLQSIVDDFPACYVRAAITPQESVRDCESRIIFSLGPRATFCVSNVNASSWSASRPLLWVVGCAIVSAQIVSGFVSLANQSTAPPWLQVSSLAADPLAPYYLACSVSKRCWPILG